MADVNNDIKMLFFIINSLSGLVSGLVTLSVGVALGANSDMHYIPGATFGCVIIGLITLAVAALGYVGAIRQNRIMLFIYAGVMVLVVVLDIAGATLLQSTILVSIITHLGLTVLAVILAVILGVKARKQFNQGMILNPPPAAYTPVA